MATSSSVSQSLNFGEKVLNTVGQQAWAHLEQAIISPTLNQQKTIFFSENVCNDFCITFDTFGVFGKFVELNLWYFSD